MLKSLSLCNKVLSLSLSPSLSLCMIQFRRRVPVNPKCQLILQFTFLFKLAFKETSSGLIFWPDVIGNVSGLEANHHDWPTPWPPQWSFWWPMSSIPRGSSDIPASCSHRAKLVPRTRARWQAAMKYTDCTDTVHTHTYIYIYIDIYTHMHKTHTHIYICTHTHKTHTHIYICTHTHKTHTHTHRVRAHTHPESVSCIQCYSFWNSVQSIATIVLF